MLKLYVIGKKWTRKTIIYTHNVYDNKVKRNEKKKKKIRRLRADPAQRWAIARIHTEHRLKKECVNEHTRLHAY